MSIKESQNVFGGYGESEGRYQSGFSVDSRTEISLLGENYLFGLESLHVEKDRII